MRRPPGRISAQAVAGSVSLYRYAFPFRSHCLRSYFEAHSKEAEEPLTRDYRQFSVIFEAHSAPARVWLLAEGSARLIFPAAGKTPPYSRLTIRGELVGLTETMAELPYGATLETISECKYHTVGRQALTRLLDRDPVLTAELLFTLADNISTAYSRVRAL